MVLAIVDGIDTNGVDSELLELIPQATLVWHSIWTARSLAYLRNVPCEGADVEKRISCISSSTWLVCNTADVESLAVGPESIALARDWGQGTLLTRNDLRHRSSTQTCSREERR